MTTSSMPANATVKPRAHLVARLAALAALAGTTTTPAAAYDPSTNWMRYALQGDRPTSSAGPAYDRSFVREWEANPPKGFPTLSKENIAATKTAILTQFPGIWFQHTSMGYAFDSPTSGYCPP